ncbi:fumarylacetoacetate hydrolase family protein [Nocardia salmonicida]|uniref:fumarylacetoacetate hydrolase family protein n=1 Tax=Nocardia salmonicida TaxID=53431 RepID=UPI00366BDB2C
MRLSTIRLADGGTTAAAGSGDGWCRLAAPDVGVLLAQPEWQTVAARRIDGAETSHWGSGADLAPVVMSPRKVICCGHNYRAHIAEMGRGTPEFPTLFTKFADTLTGPVDDIRVPEGASELDWEAELAVVVGRPLRHADEATATAAIAGYTIANDFSVRSWQHRTSQWLPGKAFDATTPLGPELVTPDEIDPGDGLRLTCAVNGVVVQQGSTNDLLFSPAKLLAYISTFTRLDPGDLVLTGTPGGVGAGAKPPRYLNDGDVVETVIEGIGALRNLIRTSTHIEKNS